MGVFLAVVDDLWRLTLLWCLRGLGFFYPALNAARQAGVEGAAVLPISAHDKKREQPPLYATGSVYYIGAPHAYVYLHPAVEFDAVCETLDYGEVVRLIGFEGRWAHIRHGSFEGWVFKDALCAQARDIFPSFQPGAYYAHDDAEAEKLRRSIGDAFHAADAALPLSDAEFVTYQLERKGKRIAWGPARPRMAGSWQLMLKGMRGVHMSVHPHTDSVMEYVADDIGHLAFVNAVFPDQGISLKAFGMHEQGMYEELAMAKEEWKELRPVFIEVL